MSIWREGTFEKHRISGIWHPFTPAHAVTNLYQIDLDMLWKSGKRLLLLDVDNTLVQWRTEDFSDPVLAWINRAKHMGFEICLVSNTNREDRLARLREMLGVESVRGRFKPSRAMYRLGMMKFKRKPEETVMVGDQLMTDIFGANRSGIDAIWVRKMEGIEFGPTKINRAMERFFQSFIYHALVAPVDEKPSHESEKPLTETTLFHQLFRFVVVGGTSFVIDYMIRMTLMFAVPYGNARLSDVAGETLRTSLPAVFGFAEKPADAFFPVAATIAAAIAILNSFIWNRFWTFEIRGNYERMKHLRRFVLVAVIGLVFNVLISTFLNHILAFDAKWNARIATVAAALMVAVWNFTGQRYYAFKSRRPPTERFVTPTARADGE